MRTIIRKLNIASLLHPEDKSTMDTLKKIPGFKKIVDKTVVNIMERYAAIEYISDGINVSEQSQPAVYKQLREACRILNVTDIPNCSTDWDYNIAVFSVGEKHPRIVVQSGTVDLLNEDELLFLLGHELGHLMCGHKTYHMLVEAMYNTILDSELGILKNIIRMPLLNWYRISDFTADRIGLLCCQDIDIALRAMIKMAGLPKKYYEQIDMQSFIQQAIDFHNNYSNSLDSVIKYLSINAASMPWLVVRAGELYAWYKSGAYTRILNNNNNNNKLY